MNEKLEVGDTVQIRDWKEAREGSQYGREFYEKLAHPNAKYVIQHITSMMEVYVHGLNNYFKYNLLEKC